MSKTKSKKKTSQEDKSNELAAAEAKKNELVQFVANNIINTLTLSQTVTLIQQVSLRDANTIVTDADEEKLAEIEEAYEANKAAAQASQQAATDPGNAPEVAPA